MVDAVGRGVLSIVGGVVGAEEGGDIGGTGARVEES